MGASRALRAKRLFPYVLVFRTLGNWNSRITNYYSITEIRLSNKLPSIGDNSNDFSR